MLESRRVKRILFILFAGVCLCGCSLSKHLARVSARVERDYAQTKEWRSLPEKTITWDQALSLLSKYSLELKEAQDSIESAQRQSLSIYTDMIPGVSYYGYMTRAISELADPMNSDELSSSINVTFSVPALTQVPYRVYSAKVRTFAAVKAKEGRYREAVTKLYQLVRNREIELARRALEDANPEEANATPDPRREQNRWQSDEKYWLDVARLIGRRDARWNILPQSMPHVNWKEYEPRLDRLGELVVCQFAMRLEQARMAQYGVALNYLPTINTSLYSPSLFSSSGGTYQGTFLDEDDTRINLSISYMLDTHLSNWDSYQQNKARYEREKIKVADELTDHRSRIQLLRRSMNEYSNWRNFMHKHMEYLSSRSPQTAEEYIERKKTLYSMRSELLNQEASSIESEAALIMEYGLPGETPEGSVKVR